MREREGEKKKIALIHSFLWSPPLHTLTNTHTPIPTRISITPMCSHFSLRDYSDSCISMWSCAFVCEFSPSLLSSLFPFCVSQQYKINSLFSPGRHKVTICPQVLAWPLPRSSCQRFIVFSVSSTPTPVHPPLRRCSLACQKLASVWCESTLRFHHRSSCHHLIKRHRHQLQRCLLIMLLIVIFRGFIKHYSQSSQYQVNVKFNVSVNVMTKVLVYISKSLGWTTSTDIDRYWQNNCL